MIVVLFLLIFSHCGSTVPLKLQTTQSKLSIYTAFDPNATLQWDFVQTAKPRVIKVVGGKPDDYKKTFRVKKLSPGTLITCGCCGTIARTGDPKHRANEWLTCALPYINSSACDYWDAFNEPPEDVAFIRWLAQFEAERAALMYNHTKARALVGNWGTGCPNIQDPKAWSAFEPALKAALKYEAALGLHEYNWPNMWSAWDGDNIWDPTQTGWLCGRYRKVYQQFMIPNGYGKIPLIVNEIGLDHGVQPPCLKVGCGFRSQNMTVQTFINQLMWYDYVLQQDEYVLGSVLFATGIDGWKTFDLQPGGLPLYTSYVAHHS